MIWSNYTVFYVSNEQVLPITVWMFFTGTEPEIHSYVMQYLYILKTMAS